MQVVVMALGAWVVVSIPVSLACCALLRAPARPSANEPDVVVPPVDAPAAQPVDVRTVQPVDVRTVQPVDASATVIALHR